VGAAVMLLLASCLAVTNPGKPVEPVVHVAPTVGTASAADATTKEPPSAPVGVAPVGVPDVAQRTTGAIADGPLQVGCWSPLRSASPAWVFPMVRIRWMFERDQSHPMPTLVAEYARRHIREIQSRPADQPIWIVGHAWLGRSMKRDPYCWLAHELDATARGTPGIWPRYGMAIWRQRQVLFMKYLKQAGVRLDFWALDNEIHTNEWSANYKQAQAFYNIVMDVRWRTQPILGLGIRGADLLNPDRVANLMSQWVKRKWNQPDSRVAESYVSVLGRFVRRAGLNHVFAQPVLDAYPHALVSNYRGYTILLSRAPTPLLAPISNQSVWRQLQRVKPDLQRLPRVGNTASPALYGGIKYQRMNRADTVGTMLELVDGLIALHGGPQHIAPWIAYPTFGKNGRRNLSPQQYRRLIVGLAERGIRRLILWNGDEKAAMPQCEAELLKVLGEAYAVASKHR